jgi:ribonuclease HI
MQINIWTDGSATPNPGRGGWAAILESNGHRKEISGRMNGTSTSNQAELSAVIEAFKALKGGPHEVTIHTDSEYTKRAIEGMKKPRANRQLLEVITGLVANQHSVAVQWVEAHSGDTNNERCDTLAKAAEMA